MGLLRFFSKSSAASPGETLEAIDESGDIVEATFEGKGKHAGGRVVVTSTEGRYEGMGQYVERERIVRKKAEPQPKDEYE